MSKWQLEGFKRIYLSQIHVVHWYNCVYFSCMMTFALVMIGSSKTIKCAWISSGSWRWNIFQREKKVAECPLPAAQHGSSALQLSTAHQGCSSAPYRVKQNCTAHNSQVLVWGDSEVCGNVWKKTPSRCLISRWGHVWCGRCRLCQLRLFPSQTVYLQASSLWLLCRMQVLAQIESVRPPSFYCVCKDYILFNNCSVFESMWFIFTHGHELTVK